MFLINIEVRVKITVSLSNTDASAAQLDANERRKEMEPMDCDTCETAEKTDNVWFNDENKEPFCHRMDEMNCSDTQCGRGTRENIRKETVTPMEVDS